MFQLLLVEDNPVFRQTLAEALQERFPAIRIIQRDSAEAALELTANTVPDLIVMDIRLGGKSGLEAARELLRTHQDLKVVLLSNHDLPEYRQAAVSAGACQLISKNDDYVSEITSLLNQDLLVN